MIQPTPAMNADGGDDVPFFLGTPVADPARTRLGIIVLVIGLLMVFWAWGSWVYRVSADPAAAALQYSDSDAAPTPEQVKAASGMKLLLIVGFVLFLAVLLGTFVLVRSARRFREASARSRAAPTPAIDAWAMHRLPQSKSGHEA